MNVAAKERPRSGQSVRKLWSTGQIARLVGTNVKTVATWIDQGEMKGVKLPGTKERRVHRDELRRFLARYDYTWATKELDEEEGIAAPGDVPPPPPPAPPPPPPRRGKGKDKGRGPA